MQPDPQLDVQRHSHDSAHFIFLIRGAYLTSARGAPPVCVEPTLIYNPPGTTHRDTFLRSSGGCTGRFLSISFAAGALARIAQHVPLIEEAICLRGPGPSILGARLARECRAWESSSALVAEGICLELAALAARREVREDVVAPSWLRRAREMLHQPAVGHIAIGSIARECGVHPVHLARTFRRFFRCSPGDYQRRARLERAAGMLTGGRLSLSEVALASGFVDQSHMSHAFRRTYAVAPGEYRRLLAPRE